MNNQYGFTDDEWLRILETARQASIAGVHTSADDIAVGLLRTYPLPQIPRWKLFLLKWQWRFEDLKEWLFRSWE